MPAHRHLRVAEIEVNASPTDERIVGIFRYESEQKGKHGPLLVLMAEITSTLYVYEQLLDVVNDALERLRPLVSGVDTDPMARFEKLVQGLNTSIAQFVAEETAPIAWNRVNMFLLEVNEEHLCLTGLGHLCNIFLQRQPDGSTRAFDLFGSLEQPADVQSDKAFSGLIYGELKTGDILFAGTQNFERLRHELGIVQRLKQAPPVTAALDIQQALETQHIPDDFGAIILAQVELEEPLAKPATPPEPEVVKEKSTASVEKMYAEEKTAEAMLSPAMTPLARLKPKADGTLHDYLEQLTQRLRNVPRDISKLINKRREPHDPVTLAGLRTMNAGHGSFLTRKHKLAILGGVGALFVCVGGTLWYKHAQRVNAEQAAWNTAYEEVLDKKNRAEASLVYGDDDRGLRLFQEAEAIFSRLDTNTPKRAEGHKTLETALNELRAKLRKEQHISDPRVLFSLPAEAGDATLNTLSSAEGKVYTYDSFTKEIVVLEPTNNLVKRLSWISQSPPVSATAAKNSSLFFTADKKAFRAEPLKTTVSELTYDSKPADTLAAATIYGTRVYVLDPKGKMVWRHNLGSAIGTGATYIKQTSANLEQATSLAIDSNIYVGFQDGQIIRYLSGAQETWAPLPIDPPLRNVSGLWTAPESDRLIVTDSVNKRVIVLRKDGKLIAQITSPKFTGPKAVTVDLATKQIFVADGNSVYTFDLP